MARHFDEHAPRRSYSIDAKRNISSVKLYSLVLALNTSLGSLQQSRGPHREFVQGKQYSQELSSNKRCGMPSIAPDLPETLIKSPSWTTAMWRWTIRLYLSIIPSSMPIALDCHSANWYAPKGSDTLTINSLNLETKARVCTIPQDGSEFLEGQRKSKK